MKPYIAVIIPVYNVRNFLKPSLDSVLSQDYDNFTVIAVDDNSTDGCVRILKQYESEYDNLHCIYSEKNEGLSETRNKGEEYARSLNPRPDYIIYLDSDDLFEPGTLKYLADISNGSDLVWFNYGCYDEDLKTAITRENEETTPIWLDVMGYEEGHTMSGKQWVSDFIESGIQDFYAACFALIKLDYLDRIGLNFTKGVLWEDHTYGKKLFIDAGKITVTNNKFYRYTLRRSSICNGVKVYGWERPIVDLFDKKTSGKNYVSLYSWVVITEELLDYLDTKNEEWVDKFREICMMFYLKEIGWAVEYKGHDPLGLAVRVQNILDRSPNKCKWTESYKTIQGWVKKQTSKTKRLNLIGGING